MKRNWRKTDRRGAVHVAGLVRRSAAAAFVCALLLLCAGSRADAPADISMSVLPTISEPDDRPENRTVRVCVTELLADTDLLYLLRRQFEAQSDYRLELSENPDNVAVSVAQSGTADILLVQNGHTVQRFVSVGYGTECERWIRSSLVLAGPAGDPAQVRSAATAAEAMARIAGTSSAFVSRYDDSDVNRVETGLWSAAGVVIGNGRAWFKAARMEMVGSMELADSTDAYILCEKEPFLQHRDALHLQILLDGTEDLQTRFCIVPVSAEAVEGVNAQGAQAFLDWLQSPEAQSIYTSYGTDSYGCPIFELDKMEESQ